MISIPQKIYLSKSQVHGIGVFAKDIILQNEIIEICPVIDIGLSKNEVSHILIDYRFNWPQGNENVEKQVVCAGYGMIYNHSQFPNANWRSNLESNCFEFYAIKDILVNEEIFVWYGDDSYWNDGRTNILFK